MPHSADFIEFLDEEFYDPEEFMIDLVSENVCADFVYLTEESHQYLKESMFEYRMYHD